MQNNDIRWVQRFGNFCKALAQLTKFIAKGDLNELEKQGLIQCFEYTYELAWNTLKDFYQSQAETDIQGSKDAIRLAFKRGLIENGEAWMDMIKSRTLTSHTYNEDLADQIVSAILNSYYQEFVELQKKLSALVEKTSGES
ncbi:MAG: nucleotidyltransferase substrate binding protein [Methylobacter sp.]|nr:nucleotidyltransferase substrate binding protein [Methylobacter sp.]